MCPLIDRYAKPNGFRAVRHFGNHSMDGAHLFASRWSGGYFTPIPSMFGRVGCIAHVYRNEYNPGM